MLADIVDLVGEQTRDVGGVVRRGDRDDGAGFRDPICRRQHRRAAEAMPDQDGGRLAGLAQMVGRTYEIVDVG